MPQGTSVRLTSPLVDAKDEKQAVEIAHKKLTDDGFPKEGRTVVRVKPVWALNKRSMLNLSSSL